MILFIAISKVYMLLFIFTVYINQQVKAYQLAILRVSMNSAYISYAIGAILALFV